MPVPRSPERGDAEMLKHRGFFGDQGQAMWAEDSSFSRTQLSALSFLLRASKIKSLHSPPVP